MFCDNLAVRPCNPASSLVVVLAMLVRAFQVLGIPVLHFFQQGYVFGDAHRCRRGCCCAIYFVPKGVEFFESNHARQMMRSHSFKR